MPTQQKSFKWRYDPSVKERLKAAAKARKLSENWLINHLLDQALTPEFVAGTERLW